MEKIFEGNYIAQNHGDDCPYTEITGDADFRGWTGSAPVLQTIGGSAYFRGWTGSAPVLQTIGGSADFRGCTGSAPLLLDNYIFSKKIGSRDAICKFDKKTGIYHTGCFKGDASQLLDACINKYGINHHYTRQYEEFITLRGNLNLVADFS
jgi:hypothetical protein